MIIHGLLMSVPNAMDDDVICHTLNTLEITKGLI